MPMSYEGRDPVIFAELDRRIAEEEAETRRKTRAATPPEPPEPPGELVPPETPKPAAPEPPAAERLPGRRGRYRQRAVQIALAIGVPVWQVKRARLLVTQGRKNDLEAEGLTGIVEHLRSADR